MLKTSMVKQTTDEDPDEGIKDLVEITLKKMVSGARPCSLKRDKLRSKSETTFRSPLPLSTK